MQLQRILIYPVKSLDGVSVRESRLTTGGILEHDRTYAIVDASGNVVNGKRTARVHALRSTFSDDFREISLWEEGTPETGAIRFALAETEPVSRWLSAFFGFDVTLRHESERGFPDDTTASGPTIVSKASLREVRRWFPALSLESVRRRFRSNLELGGEEEVPFWEDRLFGEAGTLTLFQLGAVKFLGHNPCQRCVVPTRDPVDGEIETGFQTTFMEFRRATLPSWVVAARFNHYYRFAVNTSVPATEAGKVLRLGDELTTVASSA